MIRESPIAMSLLQTNTENLNVCHKSMHGGFSGFLKQVASLTRLRDL